MLQVIRHTLPYDKYDKFVLNRDNYFMVKWQLIGVFDKKHEHFIANSDNEDEIRIWADVHNITIDKTIDNYSYGQFIYADYYKHGRHIQSESKFQVQII